MRMKRIRPAGGIRRVAPALLLLAAVFLGQGASGEDGPLPGGALATFRDDSVGSEEFLSYLESREVKIERMDAEARESALREFLADRKLAAEARAKGVAGAPEVQAIVDAMDRRELPDIYFRALFLETTTVEESDFERLYDGLEDLAEVNVAVLATEAEALEFRSLLAGGRSFESLATEQSLGHSAKKGGLVQGITPGDVRFTLKEKTAIFSAPVGEVLGPFENKLEQYSVLQVVRRAMVEDQKRELRRTKEKEVRERKALAAYLAKLNEELIATEIDINEEYFEEKQDAGPKKPYVAWIRGRYIYPQDLEANVSRESHGKKVYRASLDKMLRQIIAVDLARKAGLADTPEYRRRQEAFLAARLAEFQVNRVFRNFRPEVTEQDVKKQYGESFHPEVYSIWAIINKDRAKVEKARKAVLAGAKEGDVAREYSDDMSRNRGGLIGPVSYSAFAPEVRKRLSSLRQEKVSEVFGMNGKYLIMRVVEKQVVTVPKYGDVKDDIRKSLELQQRSKAAMEYRANVIDRKAVRIDREQLSALK